MSDSPTTLAPDMYLELLKRCVLNETYLDDELRILYLRKCVLGKDHYDPATLHDIRNARRSEFDKLRAAREIGRFIDRDIHNAAYNHSMIGRRRMDSLHACLDLLRLDDIAGDVAECGVWLGGSCIFMAGYLKVHGLRRRVLLADSFEGLPRPTREEDVGLNLSKDIFPELAVDLETVKENFRVYGLLSDSVVFLKGWFKDTLPKAPVTQLGLLRLDGDLYESTSDVLEALYDRVVPGGIIIIDDYAIDACRKAAEDFFRGRDLMLPAMTAIDWTGVWFRKPCVSGQ